MPSIFALVFILLIQSAAAFQAQPPMIPKVNNYTSMRTPPVTFNTLRIQSDPAFSAKLTQVFGHSLKQQFNIPSALDTSSPNLIFKKSGDDPADQSYTINVKGDKITVTSPSEMGAFFATQSLLQMIQAKGSYWQIMSCIIKDSPRFASRGLMLDEARHFFGKVYVKHLLDTMAAHKLNVLHWHLTDNEAWRIEIKSYPKLTSVGAWHGAGTAIRTPERDQQVPGQDNPKYGGFYTQEDIKEIVAYAADRHITIIPEINVPGHSLALCTAYPEVLPRSDGDAGKGAQGLSGNVISVVREENYLMLEKIVIELAALFPNQYIHIGGNEVNHHAWQTSPEHRAFMQQNGMKNIAELQSYFTLSLEAILKKHGKKMMGWDEIMQGGRTSKDTAIMAWSSVEAGLEAARNGHSTIMTPGPHCSFDMKYPGHSETGHTWAGVVDTEQAYRWDPRFTTTLTAAQQKLIKGVQGSLSTEFVSTADAADYQLWPRACATAEVGWTDQNQRVWSDFDQRLGLHLSYLDSLNVNYRVKPPQGVLSQGLITIQPAYSTSTTVYTTDGSEPTAQSPIYTGEVFTIDQIAVLQYRTLTATGKLSKITSGAERLAVGHWTPADIIAQRQTLLSYPVSIDSDGLWFAELKRTAGEHKLQIHAAFISQASTRYNATPLLNSLLQGNDPTRVKFNLSGINPNLRYQLNLAVSGFDGNNTSGVITFDKSMYQEPPFTVTTNVPHHMDKVTTNISDYQQDTYYQSGRNIVTGDRWILSFNSPITTSQIVIDTGLAAGDATSLKSGTLEYTVNGRRWINAGPLNQGSAMIQFGNPQFIRALRITATGDQNSGVIILDPFIFP